MGFIERLRQQIEAEALVRNQREAELSRRREIEEAARQQGKAQERAFHEKRRQEAASFWQESGIEVYLSDFRKILLDHNRLGYIKPIRNDHRICYDSPSLEHTIKFKKKDPDSISSAVTWDKRNIGEGGSGDVTWDKNEWKFLVVEVLPKGDIILHAKKDVIVPVTRWRDDKDVIENSLEASFNNPGFGEFTDNTYYGLSGE